MAASKGKKNAPVKWAIGGAEPEDLPDFQSNEDIVKKNKGKLPPKGRTRVLVKRVVSKENKNGDQMLMITAEIAEGTAKKPGPFNGYTMWTNQNITEQGAPYLKRFLTAIGVTWKDFMTKTTADTTQDPAVITKIGNVKIDPSKPVEAFVSIKHGVDRDDEERAEVGRWLPPVDEDDDDEVEDDEDESEDDDDVEVDDDSEDEDESEDDDDEDSEDEEDDEDEDEDEEDGDAEAELREELDGLKLAALKKRALRAGADEDDLPGKKPALIDLIVELELGEDEEDEDEDEDEAEDEVDEEALREELSELGLPELRSRAKDNGRKPADIKGKKKPALIDMIVEDEVAPF